MLALPTSRLARGLGPLGVVGSVLLHGVVLAGLMQGGGARPSPPVVQGPPLLTVALLTLSQPSVVIDPEPAEILPPARPETAAPAPPRPILNTPALNAVPVPPPPRAKPAPKTATSQAQAPAALAAPIAAIPADSSAPAPPPEITTASPAPAEPVRMSTVRFRTRTPPLYPTQARRDEIEGIVRLRLDVSPTGRVLEAIILKSSGHRPLDHAAETAAKGWTLYPAEKDGQPVPGWAEVDVPFGLYD